MIINYLKKHPNLYTIIRTLYTPIRNIKIKKKVKYYTNKGIANLNNCKNKKKIFYFGVPIHTNLGDLAQYYCILRWLKENYPQYEIFDFETYSTYSKKFRKMLLNKINKEDLIVFQSGYCTKENHLDHKMHRMIVKQFPNNKIIFFPQTINFFDKRELDKTAKIYNAHNNIIFLARDKISYNIAIKNFTTAKILLFPDIVTTLIGNFKFKESKNKEGLLLCLRNDGEKLYNDNLYKSADLKNKYKKIDKCDTNSQYSYENTIDNLEQIIREFIEKISTYETVITDRYHGTIFSLISNTYVIVVPTNDHKVKTGVKWFEGIYDSVVLAKSPENAINIAQTKTIKNNIKNENYFEKKYYNNLKNEIGD